MVSFLRSKESFPINRVRISTKISYNYLGNIPNIARTFAAHHNSNFLYMWTIFWSDFRVLIKAWWEGTLAGNLKARWYFYENLESRMIKTKGKHTPHLSQWFPYHLIFLAKKIKINNIWKDIQLYMKTVRFEARFLFASNCFLSFDFLQSKLAIIDISMKFYLLPVTISIYVYFSDTHIFIFHFQSWKKFLSKRRGGRDARGSVYIVHLLLYTSIRSVIFLARNDQNSLVSLTNKYLWDI